MTDVLLVTSNGAGMGHLTRQAAVALSMGTSDSATIFSLSLGLPLVSALGIRCEYCPSYDRPWIASGEWNSYLRDRLIAIAEETGSEAVLFDGVAPYAGIAHAARELRRIPFIWLRRGMWKEANRRSLKRSRVFDMVIEPGDLGLEGDSGPTSQRGDSVRVGPISILEPLGTLPRAEARSRLGLPADGPVALVTFGSGMTGDVAGPGGVIVKTLLEKANDWHIAVTRSPVARDEITTDQADRLTRLGGVYPLATYLSAFDMAVSSAGYNSVHELIPTGVPSLLVGNTSTRTDDQVSRASSLERQGLALAAADTDIRGLETKLHEMLDDERRSGLGEKGRETMSLMTGASETGDLVTGFAKTFDYRKMTAPRLVRVQIESGKDLVRHFLGDEKTERLKRLLGRPPKPVHHKARVRLVDTRSGGDGDALGLALVGEMSIPDLRADRPIEHVLPGSSLDYQQRRREIIDHYYNVVSG